jgi:NAD+ kinase
VPEYRCPGIVANPQRPDVPEAVKSAVAWLSTRGLEVRVAPDLRDKLRLDLPAFDWASLAGSVDLLLTFGGDGTILFAARHLAGQPIPIFGVNTGTLGFLTSSSRESMDQGFELLFEGRGEVESYMTLSADVRRAGGGDDRGAGWTAAAGATPPPDAMAVRTGGSTAGAATPAARSRLVGLNDVVLHKGAVTARVLDLRLEVDGDEVGTYVADGLILATPVGSTGYALSAQGPLVVPTMEAIVAAPICAHALAIRPLVLPATADVRVTVLDLQEPASLAVDGSVACELAEGDVVAVTRGEHAVRLVRLPGLSFFRLLRSKLHWGGRTSRA